MATIALEITGTAAADLVTDVLVTDETAIIEITTIAIGTGAMATDEEMAGDPPRG